MKPPTKVVWYDRPKHHVHTSKPHPDLLRPVKNAKDSAGIIMKPETGGLWTSPQDSQWSWQHWVRREGLRWLGDRYLLTVEPGVDLLVVDSKEDFDRLWERYPLESVRDYRILDWESMAKEHDGLWVTERGFWANRYRWDTGWMLGLSGWDCETVLWFRWAFTSVRRTRKERP